MKPQIFWIIVLVFAAVTLIGVARREYYSERHPVIDEIRRRLYAINPAYFRIPIKTGHKSYTESKSAITLCIFNPDTGKFYDMNTLMYVALHELAHCITKADGDESHGAEFKRNFTRLLQEAHAKKVYDPRIPIPLTYCGVGPNE